MGGSQIYVLVPKSHSLNLKKGSLNPKEEFFVPRPPLGLKSGIFCHEHIGPLLPESAAESYSLNPKLNERLREEVIGSTIIQGIRFRDPALQDLRNMFFCSV